MKTLYAITIASVFVSAALFHVACKEDQGDSGIGTYYPVSAEPGRVYALVVTVGHGGEIHVPTDGDSIQLFVNVADITDGIELPAVGVLISFSSNPVGPFNPWPVTDDSGKVSTFWHARHPEDNPLSPEITAEVTAAIGPYSDSRLILVRWGQGQHEPDPIPNVSKTSLLNDRFRYSE